MSVPARELPGQTHLRQVEGHLVAVYLVLPLPAVSVPIASVPRADTVPVPALQLVAAALSRLHAPDLVRTVAAVVIPVTLPQRLDTQPVHALVLLVRARLGGTRKYYLMALGVDRGERNSRAI